MIIIIIISSIFRITIIPIATAAVESLVKNELSLLLLLILLLLPPPPSVIYLFRGFPGHAGEHVPKSRGHVQFLIQNRVYRLWHCAGRIVFI